MSQEKPKSKEEKESIIEGRYVLIKYFHCDQDEELDHCSFIQNHKR